MTADDILSALKGSLPGLQAETAPAFDRPTLVVSRDQLMAVLGVLREHEALQFMLLSDLTAADWWPGEPRFQVVYHLTSIERRLQLRLKVFLRGDAARIGTVTGLWPGADWLEREVFDLYGIVFEGHPDLRRVLMPEDWEGYPLRKDYPLQIKMPVKIYEPLHLSTEQFQKNIEDDQRAREELARRRRDDS